MTTARFMVPTRDRNKIRGTSPAWWLGAMVAGAGLLVYPFSISADPADAAPRHPVLSAAPSGPFFATGMRITEVGTDRATIWTRLTRHPQAADRSAPLPEVGTVHPETGVFLKTNQYAAGAKVTVRYPEGHSLETIAGATPGVGGEVHLRYRREKTTTWTDLPGRAADPKRDATAVFRLEGLQPDTAYELELRARPGSQTLAGHFRTAPGPEQPAKVVLAVSTGQKYINVDSPRGWLIYDSILQLEPSFFVHTGDIVYYDVLAKNIDLARYHWARTYSFPTAVNFHRQVPAYFIKDDHDTLMNDCWPGQTASKMGDLTFEQGQAVFLEQTGMVNPTYRTARWGADLQVWMVEGRDFRSPNNMPDGPDKTIWGPEQWAWLQQSMTASDATFRILISPTPVIGPDRTNKGDNHANRAFAHEGKQVRAFLAGLDNTFAVCGDRHWQYVSQDPVTGLREYSCGPASDQHAGGWKQNNKRSEHRFLRVKGGFLSVTCERLEKLPTLTFRHHAVNGDIVYQEVHTAL